MLTVIKTIKWYVPFVAKKTGQLIPMGSGIYRIPDTTDFEDAGADAEDFALEDGEPEAGES